MVEGEPDLTPYGSLDRGVLEQDKAVRHPGNVVGDHPGKAFQRGFNVVANRKLFRRIHPKIEESGDNFFSFVMLSGESVAGIERVIKVALLLQALGLD